MKAKLDVKKFGATGGMKVLTFLMLCALWAMVWVFVQVGKQAEIDSTRLAEVGEQQVLSQRVAKYVLAATAGDTDAFRKMEASKDSFSGIITSQNNAFGADSGRVGARESRALVRLEKHWRGTSDNIDKVLDGKVLVMALAEVASLMNEAMPKLMEHTQGIVDILVKNGASAGQVMLASQQAVLLQRMANSLNGAMTGAGVESATAAFKQDTREFVRVLDGFKRGTGGIEMLIGKSLQTRIQKIARLFGRVSDNVDTIVENSDELVNVQKAAVEISAQSEHLFDEALALRTALEESASGRLIRNELAYSVGAVALFILFWMGFEILRAQRRRSGMAENENVHNQEAIMRLLDEMGGLAEGDLTVHATVSEDFTGSIADSVNVTVDSLRGLVRTINDTSSQLSASVQETEAVASHMSEASSKQSQDISAAGSAIHVMSSSMDDVSREANESSKVAMRSVEIARKGGEKVQSTMAGMDTIREHIQETSKRIKRLGESSQEIGDIVELINDIAEQTNILALNASIQAAMAGEAGRGFAVVADEVQRLAERSANATRQIEALVKTIQADTNEAVISMEKSTTGVVDGAQLAEDAGSALEEIESVSNQLAGLIQNISDSAGSQATAAAEISQTMAGIQEVTTQATSGTEKTARSIGNLARLAHDLDTSVAGFKLPE